METSELCSAIRRLNETFTHQKLTDFVISRHFDDAKVFTARGLFWFRLLDWNRVTIEWFLDVWPTFIRCSFNIQWEDGNSTCERRRRRISLQIGGAEIEHGYSVSERYQRWKLLWRQGHSFIEAEAKKGAIILWGVTYWHATVRKRKIRHILTDHRKK